MYWLKLAANLHNPYLDQLLATGITQSDVQHPTIEPKCQGHVLEADKPLSVCNAMFTWLQGSKLEEDRERKTRKRFRVL